MSRIKTYITLWAAAERLGIPPGHFERMCEAEVIDWRWHDRTKFVLESDVEQLTALSA